jgi:hypothetical protein
MPCYYVTIYGDYFDASVCVTFRPLCWDFICSARDCCVLLWHARQVYDELTSLVARLKPLVQEGFADIVTPELESKTQAILNRAHATKLEAGRQDLRDLLTAEARSAWILAHAMLQDHLVCSFLCGHQLTRATPWQAMLIRAWVQSQGKPLATRQQMLEKHVQRWTETRLDASEWINATLWGAVQGALAGKDK